MIITQQYIIILVISLILTVITLAIDKHKALRNTAALILVILIIWLCVINFAATLTLLVLFTGIISLIDLLFFHRRRLLRGKPQPLIVEYARSFFFVLLLVWVIRSFIVQPYRVPSGSLQPTIKPGDFLAVNQFAYGVRFPVLNSKFINTGEPKRGDIVLFYSPPNPSIIFIKRLIGLPGDVVAYKNKVLYINGKEMKQTALGSTIDDEPALGPIPEEHIPVLLKTEDLDGVKHEIYVMPSGGMDRDFEMTIPSGTYFMMGDNRDNSDDSRVWGVVPEENLIGKPFGIWFSWDSLNHRVRWDRIPMAVK